jgi:RNA binding activity-knot of a chromodomain
MYFGLVYAQTDEKDEYSYDYYIHFEGFNRRNDMWVTRDLIETVKNILFKL